MTTLYSLAEVSKVITRVIEGVTFRKITFKAVCSLMWCSLFI